MLCNERGLPTRGSVEDEEADLVLWKMDRAFEADVRRPLRQLVCGRARPLLARFALSGAATSEIRFDEVARHALDATGGPTR